MRRRHVIAVVIFIAVTCASCLAQVLTPMELPDPKAQRLQQRHLQALMAIGAEIRKHPFPYPFYFARTIDLDVDKFQAVDQRSIRFDVYRNQTVLEVTGSYCVSYAADRMDAAARVKETFEKVIVPVLQAEAPHFPDDSEFSAFAIEVAHHVRQKIMKVVSEVPENVTVIFPVPAAQRLIDSKNDDQRQAAIMDAQIYLNGQPFVLWLKDGAPTEEWKEQTAAQMKTVRASNSAQDAIATASPSVSTNLLKAAPLRIITPEILAGLQRQNQDAVDRVVKELDSQAHFLAYAPPTYIGFRQGAYLQLSFRTTVDAVSTTSRYKLAALAFDEHVSHLIRPLLNYFPPEVEFDGVDFSTTIHSSDDGKTEAVEFFLPYRMMRCFADYDCTGQQLLDSGTVVIDGERAALDLQVAESKN